MNNTITVKSLKKGKLGIYESEYQCDLEKKIFCTALDDVFVRCDDRWTITVGANAEIHCGSNCIITTKEKSKIYAGHNSVITTQDAFIDVADYSIVNAPGFSTIKYESHSIIMFSANRKILIPLNTDVRNVSLINLSDPNNQVIVPAKPVTMKVEVIKNRTLKMTKEIFKQKAYLILMDNIYKYPELKPVFYYVMRDNLISIEESTLDPDELDLLNVLEMGFVWDKTDEGSAYWVRFKDKVQNNIYIYDLPYKKVAKTDAGTKIMRLNLSNISSKERMFINEVGAVFSYSKDSSTRVTLLPDEEVFTINLKLL